MTFRNEDQSKEQITRFKLLSLNLELGMKFSILGIIQNEYHTVCKIGDSCK